MSEIAVTNPRTGLVDYHVPACGRGQLEAISADLRVAQKAWEASGVAARCKVLKRWRAALQQHAADIASALCVDTGRQLMAHIEVNSVEQWVGHWAGHAPALFKTRSGQSLMAPSVHYSHQLKPYPLVGIISPWNVPLILGLIDATPALAAGCAVLIKPSEVTPRFVKPLQAALDEVPELAAVLKIVTGGADTGQALIDQVDAVCFTGSVPTGRKIAAQAAANFIPAFLELGGKDPAVVLASADLDNAANAILRSAAGMTGQACQSLERIYVQREVADEFVQLLVEKANAVELNWPDLQRGQLGPFIFAPQAHIVQQQIDEAVAAGASVLCGGQVEQHGGWWCRPTVLTGVDHGMRVMRQETFGPLMPVMVFEDIDEAVELANDSIYGLSGAVFAGSQEEGEAVARRLVGGAISINDASLTAMVHDVEKNSFCQSGMGGSRMGDAGLLRFFRKQAILYQSAAAAPISVMSERNTNLQEQA
jgi:acyl-CoA reductase-like NAD-dependent aldehyde dehydrogenase